MIQASPERNFSSREDTLLKNTTDIFDKNGPLTTSDVVILGEDVIETHEVPYYREPGFIGPIDATDEARQLHTNQAKNLAQVAVLNIGAYGREYQRVIAAVTESVSDGVLRLNAEYPAMNADQQVDAFVSNSMLHAYKSYDEVDAELMEEKMQQRLGSNGPERALQETINDLSKSLEAQGNRIFAARALLKKAGASEGFLREYDYTTKIMLVPLQEAYEREKELTPEAGVAPLVNTEEVKLFDKFKDVISSLSKEGIKLVGIHAPRSGEVTIIHQSEKTVSK